MDCARLWSDSRPFLRLFTPNARTQHPHRRIVQAVFGFALPRPKPNLKFEFRKPILILNSPIPF